MRPILRISPKKMYLFRFSLGIPDSTAIIALHYKSYYTAQIKTVSAYLMTKLRERVIDENNRRLKKCKMRPREKFR